MKISTIGKHAVQTRPFRLRALFGISHLLRPHPSHILYGMMLVWMVGMAASPMRLYSQQAEVEWLVWNETIYEGQTIVVSLVIYDSSASTFPEEIVIPQPSGVLFEEVEGLGEIEVVSIGDQELFRVPVAVFLLTASDSGTVTLPSATVLDGAIRKTARAKQLRIEPLPEITQGAQGVGTFTFFAEIDIPSIIEGETAIMTMEIEGEGNLQLIQFPDAYSETAIIVELDETADLLPSNNGYRGRRQKRFRIIPTQSGNTEVRIEQFRWYDVNTETVGIVSFQPINLYVFSGTEFSTTEQIPLSILTPDEIKQIQTAFRPPRWLYGVAALPPVIIIIIAGGIRRRAARKKMVPSVTLLCMMVLLSGCSQPQEIDPAAEQLLAEGYSGYIEGDYERAIQFFSAAERAYPDNPGIEYNLGLAHFLGGNRAQGIYHMYDIFRTYGNFPPARDVLQWMEARLELTEQVAPPARFLRIILLVMVYLLLYIIALVFLFYSRLPHEALPLVLIFAVVSMFVCGGLLLYSILNQDNIVIVSQPHTSLMHIPSPHARQWISLNEGMALHWINRYQDFYQVRTSYGVVGWVAASDLLFLEPE